jgi:hypothetical protein
MSDHKEQYDAGRLSTSSGSAPKHFGSPAPDLSVKANGQHPDYWVLSEAERAKGFVRPVRGSYKHVGIAGPRYDVVRLTPAEQSEFGDEKFVAFERYPESESPATGRYWTQAQLDSVGKGCGTVTRMSRPIAETYAREPGFYGSTMCVNCHKHLPVGASGEFVWVDESGATTTERVGT